MNNIMQSRVPLYRTLHITRETLSAIIYMTVRIFIIFIIIINGHDEDNIILKTCKYIYTLYTVHAVKMVVASNR